LIRLEFFATRDGMPAMRVAVAVSATTATEQLQQLPLLRIAMADLATALSLSLRLTKITVLRHLV
jgi:hypothetical protein